MARYPRGEEETFSGVYPQARVYVAWTMLEGALRQVALPRNLAFVPGLTTNYTCGGAATAGTNCGPETSPGLLKPWCEAWSQCLSEIQGASWQHRSVQTWCPLLSDGASCHTEVSQRI